MRGIHCFVLALLALQHVSCNKGSSSNDQPTTPPVFQLNSTSLDGKAPGTENYNVPFSPVIRLNFNGKVDKGTVAAAVHLTSESGAVAYTASYANGDSSLVIQPASPLSSIVRHDFSISTSLKATTGASLMSGTNFTFVTKIDSIAKFPQLTEDELLTKVQQQTFKYFWDFGHPVSGLARERNSSGDVVTSGGSGFGIMAIVAGIHRGFVTRAQGLARMQIIVRFLKDQAQTFKGAYPHWLNGATGVVVPFSANDNGADLVETSYLMQGLITARQYFNGADASETSLRSDINTIWNRVEWSWFTKGGEQVLYWHWSPSVNWVMNVQIKGWNEALITYVMAASSTTYPITKAVYDNGWASNGGMRNGAAYYGITLPLGPAFGGPLFFSHYSFLGINPKSLTDAYANYEMQNQNHALINYNYCKTNPKGYFGYSDSVWGLTASDIKGGYTASSPTNDVGVIAPTAALSSFPYTPTESMKTLKFFYYTLGDKIWKEYGFIDAFSLKEPWFANSFLAIDQGPIIIMIENYRSGLLWNLFMSAPEVKTGMRALGFQSPNL
ncbi:glucoamylase family protein [Flavisolibacter tropicus]|uniref:Periplasmic beta-glucosidase n=1 Tax=Flavisolibacter tropicus TaxID=1492898 RepID=A0A172TVN5_9BACT|nr:glucoamylase family protein [Flavisolibacter tropicus]ANE51046.1 periplasmic beta-glucosidase [Flavisolibacter tropicus]